MINECPFKVGDWVCYKPSIRGRGLQEGDFLVPDRNYQILRIEKERYVVVEGEDHPGGGLYWTEFIIAERTGSTKKG
ncbi:MAG: hypothetical protein WCI03_12200 [bacterium]